jgi:hypothetical protein
MFSVKYRPATLVLCSEIVNYIYFMCTVDIKYFDNSAPSCPPVECPEGFKVVLKKPEQLKTPEESSAAFKGRFKGMSL